MDDVKIEVKCDPSAEETDLIFNGLVEFNESQVRDARFKEFGILASGESAAIIAGLLGHTLWNGFFISALWVAEAVRRKGIGRQLLKRAEELAMQNGCEHIHLDTFDFQARDFYQKNGFQIFGTIEDYPIGHKRYYLVKKLAVRSNEPSRFLGGDVVGEATRERFAYITPRCCRSASCRQERIIMRTIPQSKNVSMPSMKTTLQEKLALIPPTPESPITLDGSLHPSQAMSDGP